MDIELDDFPVTADFNWKEVAVKIGFENALWIMDRYGGGERKHICTAETVRRNARNRLKTVPRETAERLPE